MKWYFWILVVLAVGLIAWLLRDRARRAEEAKFIAPDLFYKQTGPEESMTTLYWMVDGKYYRTHNYGATGGIKVEITKDEYNNAYKA